MRVPRVDLARLRPWLFPACAQGGWQNKVTARMLIDNLNYKPIKHGAPWWAPRLCLLPSVSHAEPLGRAPCVPWANARQCGACMRACVPRRPQCTRSRRPCCWWRARPTRSRRSRASSRPRRSWATGEREGGRGALRGKPGCWGARVGKVTARVWACGRRCRAERAGGARAVLRWVRRAELLVRPYGHIEMHRRMSSPEVCAAGPPARMWHGGGDRGSCGSTA